MLFFYLSLVAIRSQMQYKASFFMLTFSHFLATFTDILAMWILFDRFHLIQGWKLEEVGLIYGIVHISFSFAEAFARGFEKFSLIIKQGNFDLVLLRPISSLLQIATREVQLMRLGRFIQGLLVLIWSFHRLKFSLISPHTFLIAFSMLGTFCVFYGLLVIQAAISFWTIESLELMHITTHGGLQTAQYPISIYKKTLRVVFTFIIPLGSVVFYPIASLMHKTALPSAIAFLMPLLGVGFLLISFAFWNLGVRHYQSCGS